MIWLVGLLVLACGVLLVEWRCAAFDRDWNAIERDEARRSVEGIRASREDYERLAETMRQQRDAIQAERDTLWHENDHLSKASYDLAVAVLQHPVIAREYRRKSA